MSVLVLTIVVVAGISAVAFADKSVASFSLAPLYFLPLALSALVHPLRISLALSIVCLVLHDFVGPIRDLGTRHLTKDATTLLGYVFVVVVVNQLGTQRQRLADLAARERDELASEIHLAAEVQQSIFFQDWECSVAEVQMEAGDIVCIYTYGITESVDKNGKEFGEAGLLEVLRDSRNLESASILQKVAQAVEQFRSGEQEDDVTMVIARAQ
jgi:hypothetical protein